MPGCLRPLCFATSIMLMALVFSMIATRARCAEREVLINGDLAKGSGGQPDEWRTEAWVNEPEAWSYHWTRPSAGGVGELEIDSVKPNDARWMQSPSLAPGWYFASVEIRTENVPPNATGGNISVMEDGIMSRDIKGTTNWTRVGFYLRVGPKGADVDIALRLGGYGSLNTGKAWFRKASLVQIESPPAGAQPAFDLEALRKAAQPAPIGSPLSLLLTYVILAAIALWGWRAFAKQPPRVSRAKSRRREGKRAAHR